jgi:TRAP-type C4-dicarboxylate transport system permease large subunit
MLKRGYKRHMALGPVLGAGGLAVIIPPSGLAVLLGSLAQIDIGALLLAGVLPGVVLGLLYMGLIYLQTRIDPAAAPQYAVAEMGFGAKLKMVSINILPMGFIVFFVVGFMILGIATGDMEYRSFDMPRWILDLTLPLGFGFSTIEFLRYLVGADTLFKVKAQDKDGF